MKIICDNCGAKYSIADEKVKGKVFKIRCKKCQESIVVRGDSQEQPEAAEPAAAASEGGDVETKVFDYSGYKGNDPVWYVAVDGGEQQGPYTTGQMREYLQAGNITMESYVWREGLEDWKAVSDVAEIADAGQQSAVATESAATVGAAAGASGATGEGLFDTAPAAEGGGLFDTSPVAEGGGGLFDTAPAAENTGGGLFDAADAGASPGDVFSSAPDTSTGGLFSADQNAQAATKEGGGLFDGPDASGTGGDLFAATDSGDDGGGIFASTEAQSDSPRVSSAAAMTGQRNENSVLFSLSNLQALASDTTDVESEQNSVPQMGGSFGNALGGIAGGGSNEASGLIDIRAMANSLTAEAEKADDVDDMLSLGGGGFAPTLGAPVLSAAKPMGMSMGMKIGVAAGGLVLLIGIVIAVVMLVRKDTSAQDEKIALLMKQIEEMEKRGASAADIKKVKEQVEKTQQEKQAISEGQKIEPKADEASKSKAKESARGSSSRSSRKAKSSKASSSSSPSSGSAKKDDRVSSKSLLGDSTPAPPKKRKASTNSLDSLLGGGGGSKPKKKVAAAKLTRKQVISGMNAVRGSVNRCGAGKSGTFKIKAKIDSNGRVAKTKAVGDFAGTPAGTCAANAVRRARFPQSSAATNVTYPFKI